jgi:hypothetical protein
VKFGQALRQGQAKADAAGVPFNLCEGLEDALMVGSRDPDAGVPHADAHLLCLAKVPGM